MQSDSTLMPGWMNAVTYSSSLNAEYAARAQVLLLDADNTPLRDPTAALFDSVEFRRSGALFWPGLLLYFLCMHFLRMCVECIIIARRVLNHHACYQVLRCHVLRL